MNIERIQKTSGMVGGSDAIHEVLDMVAQVAPIDISVLVTGESGTGKELVAKALHQHSKRSHQPLVTVNCGAIPEGIIESELFGVRRLNLPKKKSSDGITAHQAVKQSTDLIRLPNKFTLDCWQDVFTFVNAFKNLGYWNGWLKHDYTLFARNEWRDKGTIHRQPTNRLSNGSMSCSMKLAPVVRQNFSGP